MYATHHKTGRKVRILNQSTSTWKDKKTLVWCDPSNIDETVKWNRFDVGCVSVKNQSELNEAFDLLIQNEDERYEKGHICSTFVQMNKGATQTIINHILN